jgi:hypothetical protein
MPLHDTDSGHQGQGLVLRLAIVLRWRQKRSQSGLKPLSSIHDDIVLEFGYKSAHTRSGH